MVITYNVQLYESILAETAQAMTIMLPPSDSHSVFKEKSLSVGMRCPPCPHSEGRVTRGIVSDPEEGYWSPMTGEGAVGGNTMVKPLEWKLLRLSPLEELTCRSKRWWR